MSRIDNQAAAAASSSSPSSTAASTEGTAQDFNAAMSEASASTPAASNTPAAANTPTHAMNGSPEVSVSSAEAPSSAPAAGSALEYSNDQSEQAAGARAAQAKAGEPRTVDATKSFIPPNMYQYWQQNGGTAAGPAGTNWKVSSSTDQGTIAGLNAFAKVLKTALDGLPDLTSSDASILQDILGKDVAIGNWPSNFDFGGTSFDFANDKDSWIAFAVPKVDTVTEPTNIVHEFAHLFDKDLAFHPAGKYDPDPSGFAWMQSPYTGGHYNTGNYDVGYEVRGVQGQNYVNSILMGHFYPGNLMGYTGEERTLAGAQKAVSDRIREQTGALSTTTFDETYKAKWTGGKAVANTFADLDGSGSMDFSKRSGSSLVLGLNGNDKIIGGGKGDFLYGGNGNDKVEGRAGADKLAGDGGDDTVLGGGGNDLIYGGTGSDELFGEAGNDKIYGEAGDDAIYGGSGNDSLDGGADADDIGGGSGNDVIAGGSGVDYILGEQGNDTLNGGEGSDILDGGVGSDILSGGSGIDRFIFANTNDDGEAAFGNDVIRDFVDYGSEADVIDITDILGQGLNGFDARVKITQIGNDTRVTIDNNSTITIKNVNASTFGRQYFYQDWSPQEAPRRSMAAAPSEIEDDPAPLDDSGPGVSEDMLPDLFAELGLEVGTAQPPEMEQNSAATAQLPASVVASSESDVNEAYELH